MMNGNLNGLVKQSMSDAPQGDPGQDAMIQRILASSGMQAGQPQQSSNPYEAGLREDPANMANSGRLEPGAQQVIQKLVMEEMAKQQGAKPAAPALPQEYPQQVKQTLVR